MTEHLQGRPHERTAARRGHRDGYESRPLMTRVGTLELRVPHGREGTFETEIFDANPRSEMALGVGSMETYLEGISPRKVADVTEASCGTRIIKSTVSHLACAVGVDRNARRDRRVVEVASPSSTVLLARRGGRAQG